MAVARFHGNILFSKNFTLNVLFSHNVCFVTVFLILGFLSSWKCNLDIFVFIVTSEFLESFLSCQQITVFFPGVHDSYWTHAGDVELMNVLLRKNFVKLYKQPILENVSFCNTSPRLPFSLVKLDFRSYLRNSFYTSLHN